MYNLCQKLSPTVNRKYCLVKRVEILSANKLFTARVHDINIGSSLLFTYRNS